MKRLAVIFAVPLVFAGALLAGLYLLFSPSFLTVEMARIVAEATGKTLAFSSSPRLAVWPEPAVVFKGVRLSDPNGDAETPFVDIEQMNVRIGAAALIGRRVEIEEIRLLNPRLNLIVDSQGRGNWSRAPLRTEAADAKANTQDASGEFDLPPVYVEGGTVNFADRRSGQSFTVSRLDMVLALASLDGPVDVKGSADWRNDRVSFSLFVKSPQLLTAKGSPLDLSVSGTWLDFGFSGRAAAGKEFDLAGTVDGGARSMRGLMRWAGIKIGDGRGLGSFHASGALSLKGSALNITKAQFRLDGMKAQGEASVDFDSAAPKLTARLGVDQLDLNQYLMPGAGSFADASQGIESWSSAPIDLSLLKSIAAKAVLHARRLTYGAATMADARIDATIDGGIFNAKLQQIDMYGGKGQGQLVLNGAQAVPTLQVGFEGSGFNALRLFTDVLNFNRIGGQTELALALAATGRSQREMIASLRGAAEIKITDGAIRGIDLEGMLESVAQKIIVGWSGEAGRTSDFQVLKASFKISDGIAETTDFELVGPRLRLTGKGLLDLPKAEIDFKVAPDLEAGNAHGIAVPVVASGSWGKPKFYPDIAGVLENPKAAYETLKSLVGRAKLDEPGADLVHGGKNAGGVAGETLSGETGEAGPAPTVDLIKKELNTNTLELMNGFAGEAPPQPVVTDQ